MQKLFMLLLLLSLGNYSLQAQQEQRLAATKTPLYEVESLQLPLQNNKNLLETELANRAPGRAPHFAEVIPVDVSPATHGNWEINNDIATWRLRVPSPRAKSLNFGFDQFFMPTGGSLIIYTPDLRIIRGPFTPADNEEHEELWTPIITGDELVIEVSLPIEHRNELRLHLKTINHDYLGFAESVVSGSCNIDVVCGLADDDDLGIVDQYRDIIQSVAVYSTGGSTFCTGFLVSSAKEDCAPLFMTANHCGINNNSAASLVTYWNFNNSVCRLPGSGASGGPGDGVLNDFNTGAIHRASYGPTDFTLVELDDPVSETADAWFAGWDATENLEPDTLICVHHPSTDEKRISFQFEGVYRGEWGSGNTPITDGNHIIIEDWNIGTTEGGSSGSPLFDSDKRVVGQLHGGGAACGNDLYDTYGWFHASWIGGGTSSTRLSDWLDPDNTGVLMIDGRPQIQCSFFVGATPTTQSLCASENAEYEITVTETFEGPVSLIIENLAVGLIATFGNTTVMPGGSTTLTISGTAGLSTGIYSFNLQGTDGANTSNQSLTLQITNGVPALPILSIPADMATGQSIMPILNWEASMAITSYDLEIASDLAFTNIITTQTGLTAENFTSSVLEVSTTYYWRVSGHNICGQGGWSDVFSFETGAISCATQAAANLPSFVGPAGGSVTESTIEVNIPGVISSVRLLNLDVAHTWIGDMDATLTSPNGTTIILFSESDCGEDNMQVNFEDNTELTSIDFAGSCSDSGLAISGTYQPLDAFIAFAGEEAAGSWLLRITDNANQDGGQLNGWELDFCTILPEGATIFTSLQNTDICAGNSVTFNITLGTGFENDINLSSTGLPSGASIAFETNPAAPGSIISATISDLNELGDFDISIIADDGVAMANSDIALSINGVPGFTNLQLPVDMDVFIGGGVTNFEWDAVAGTTAYVLEVASDDAFTNILLDIDIEATTASLNLQALGLEEGQYYWRIRSVNECGESVSSFFSFIHQLVGTQEIGSAVLDIHPNPTHGLLQVSLSGDLGSGELFIDAFTSNGQKVASWQLAAITGTQQLNLSSLPAGVYWLNITSGKLHATEKIVLIR